MTTFLTEQLEVITPIEQANKRATMLIGCFDQVTISTPDEHGFVKITCR